MADYTYEINYNEQMLNRFPEVIKAIREFQVLMETEAIEVENLNVELLRILDNAYIKTADQNRIEEWEKLLEITPLPQGDDDLETWLSDRRESILARLYGDERLNTKSIAEIVSIFTGGSANSWFKDSTIYVEITPPPTNKSYKFTNVEAELTKRVPAHLNFQVSRNYYDWLEVRNNHNTWGDVNNNFESWEQVLIFTPFEN